MQKLTAVLAVAVTILAAGCGESDSSGSSKTTPTDNAAPVMTKAEFIEKADAICGEMDARVRPLDDKYDRAVDAGEYGTAADVLREALEAADDTQIKIEALDPPAADADTIARYLETTRDGIGLLRRVADRLEDEDYSALDSLANEANQLDARAEGLAQGYGFRECGSDD